MTAQLWVFAGPNGAGKSTLVAQHVRGRIPIVNPDEIAQHLARSDRSSARPRTAVGRLMEASRAAVVMREALLRRGTSFGVETTLTGRRATDLMRRARAVGYRINLVFVGLDDACLSAARVHARARRGGHDVPVADVLRRYGRSVTNLTSALALADRALVFDNSSARRRLLLTREGGRTKYLSPRLPEWAAAAIPVEMRHSTAAGAEPDGPF